MTCIPIYRSSFVTIPAVVGRVIGCELSRKIGNEGTLGGVDRGDLLVVSGLDHGIYFERLPRSTLDGLAAMAPDTKF